VIDKPAGMVVHPSPGHYTGTLVNALLGRGGTWSVAGGSARPGIVHRLDKGTSGLIVVARNDASHRALSAQLKDRSLSRTYLAIALGSFKAAAGELEGPIGRHPKDRLRMAVVKGGRFARTRYEVVERRRGHTLLRCDLDTGRTHQIRVHLAHIGHPVVGDREYAFGGSRRVTPSERQPAERLEALAPRQLLHAAQLRLAHPLSGERLELRSEWPADLAAALAEAARDPSLLARRNPLQYLGFFASDD